MYGREGRRALDALKRRAFGAAVTAVVAASAARPGDDALVTYKSLTPDKDEACAKSGLDAIRDKLDF